ncbi:MAG TPA: hypothetical protein VHM92_06190 [Allosphingosinicella sp.]|nr:hypothetical protein [Allosphingosinicella sp.]
MTDIDRRRVVQGLGGAALLAPLGGTSIAVVAEAAVNVVEKFGFVPDGRTDNYEAFQRLAGFATRQGGGNFHFPPGIYYVARYRTTDIRRRDPRLVLNAEFLRCDGLTISGTGAKIRLNGRFHRSARKGRDGLPEGTYHAAFLPFEIRHSRNVHISGFDIDGGVLAMTRDPDITETYAPLIALNASSRVTLSDLSLHHSQTDAIMISDDLIVVGSGAGLGIACRDVRLERVRCFNNARGALAPIQVLGLRASDCAFNSSAYGTGKYGRHAPGFGVDVEPDRYKPSEVDTMTGNLEFVRCEFMDNYSAFLAAYTRKYQGYLRLIDCRSSNRNNAPNHMIIGWDGGLIQGGVHDAGEGTVWTAWTDEKPSDLTIRDAEFRSSGHFGIFHTNDNNRLTMERVKIIGTHRKADFGTFPAIEAKPTGGRKNIVRGCEIFIPAARKDRSTLYDLEAGFNHCLCENNLFRTDLPATGGQHFAVQYGPGTVVRGDRFRGTAPGPADSFRPKHFSTHDTRRPYSSG